MSEGTLDDRYFEWLYKEVGAVRNRNPRRSYWRLTRQLYTIPFLWNIANDDNRLEDGIELRDEFLGGIGELERIDNWMSLPCSVLEMLIALARRASFESYGTTGDWFWHFLQNLNCKGYTDAVYSTAIEREVSRVIDRMINREYGFDGAGGLFPLREPRQDQRRVELWYQLSAYILEGDYIDHGPLV